MLLLRCDQRQSHARPCDSSGTRWRTHEGRQDSFCRARLHASGWKGESGSEAGVRVFAGEIYRCEVRRVARARKRAVVPRNSSAQTGSESISLVSIGAKGGTRTPTVLLPPAPQAGASANSATFAQGGPNREPRIANRESRCSTSSVVPASAPALEQVPPWSRRSRHASATLVRAGP